MSSLCASALAYLDDSLALLYESLGKLKAANSVDIARVIEQLKMAAESARIVRESVWSELPEASWESRQELDALLDEIQKILDARTLEQQRFRLLALATELERGNIVHRRAHRVSELNHLRDQAVEELRSQAGLEGAPQTLPGPEADQWIEWACGLQEPQDAESLQTLRNGFAHLDDFVANLEPNMWIAAASLPLESVPEPKRSTAKTQPEQFPRGTNRLKEPVVSAGQKVAASSETPAVQSEAPVLADALASLDASLALLSENLGRLKAANSVDIAEVIEHLTRTAESARTVRELVSAELPEAAWQSRQELEALVEEIQKRLEARILEQLRSRLMALANELERGSIVHRRAHRVSELNQLRDQAINELRSQAGPDGTPQALPGPEAGHWIEWACGLQEPQDAESLQALRDGFVHLDDFVANLEPNMWVAAVSPTLETLPEAEKSAADKQPEKFRPETNGFREPVVSSGPPRTELEAKSSGGHDAPRFPYHLDDLSLPALESNTLTPNDVTPPRTEEELERIQEQERALLASMMGLVSDPVGHFAHPVERPFTTEVFRETSAAPSALVSDPVRHVDPPVERPFTTEVFRETSATPATLVSEPVRHVDPPVEHPFTAEVFRETSAASASVVSDPVTHFDSPVEPPFSAEVFRELSAASATLVSDPVTRFNRPVERPFSAEVFRETIIAPPGLVSDSVDHLDRPVERPFTAKVFREAKAFREMIAGPAIASRVRDAIEALWSGKRRMWLVVAALLVLAVLGALLWRSVAILWRPDSNRTSASPVKAIESQTPDLTGSKPEDKVHDQTGMSTDSKAHTSSPKTQTEEQSKAKDQSVAPKPASKAPPAKQANERDDAVLRPPAATPGNIAVAKKEEAPPIGAGEMPVSVPGGLTNGVPKSVANVVGDIPAAMPKIAGGKVRISSGVAQGLLIHQVAPQYPSQARQAHIQGTVVLQAVIGKDGTVQSLHVLSGHPMLTQAAMDAVKRWRYKPYSLNGEPVEADTQINVKFTLSGG